MQTNETGQQTLGHNYCKPHNIRGYNKDDTVKSLWNLSDECINEDPKLRPTFKNIQEELRDITSQNLDQSFTNTFTQ